MSESHQNGAPRDALGKRRHVAVLFSDLCNYTALSEAIDPEEADRIRRGIEDTLATVVEAHGGVINQYYGDGVLAMFGYPEPDEQAVQHALEAALAMREEATRVRFERPLPAGFVVKLHSGVHSGLVLVRQGDVLHGRFELTGDAVNTAARLCAEAGPDEILVSEEALQGIAAFFETELVQALRLKGKRHALSAHRVRARSPLLTRFDASRRRGLTALVGRTRELEHLACALEEVLTGHAKVVCVLGAAGLGKTRMLDEFRTRAINARVRTFYGYCEHHANAAPLQPFLHILRQICGLSPEMTGEQAASAASNYVAEHAPELRAHLTAVFQLLSLRSAPDQASGGDADRKLLAHTPVALFREVASRTPLLLVIDDWQWADDASRRVLSALVRALADLPVLFLIAARSLDESEPLFSDADRVVLAPFSERESQLVVRALLPQSLDYRISTALHQRSGGNPLFLEELCQALPDGGNIESGATLSSTVHGVIQGRLARLSKADAQVLSAAAVIGYEFPNALLEAVVPDRTLPEALARLALADLIFESHPGVSGRFKHGITHDVVYASVNLAERRRIHAEVARAIEARYRGQSLEEQFESLAYHYSGSEDRAQAAHYAALAGQKAMQAASLDRARYQYRLALSELERLESSSEVKQRWLELALNWAGACVYEPAREQLAILERAALYATELGSDAALAHVDYWRGWIQYALGDQERAIAHSGRALEIAEQLELRKLASQLLSNLGQCYAAAGRYAEAREYLNRGILGKQRHSSAPPSAVPAGFAYALGCSALIAGDQGEFEEARAQMGRALAAVEGSGHPIEGSLLDLYGLILVWQGRWEECVETAERARITGERVNGWYVYVMSQAVMSYAHFRLRGSEASVADLERATRWLETREIGLFLSFNYGCLAEALVDVGQPEKAENFAERALRRAAQGDPFGEASAYRTLAKIRAARAGGVDDEGRELLQKALNAGLSRASPREAAVTRLYAAELGAPNADPSLRESAAEARAAFERMQMHHHLERAKRVEHALAAASPP